MCKIQKQYNTEYGYIQRTKTKQNIQDAKHGNTENIYIQIISTKTKYPNIQKQENTERIKYQKQIYTKYRKQENTGQLMYTNYKKTNQIQATNLEVTATYIYK